MMNHHLHNTLRFAAFESIYSVQNKSVLPPDLQLSQAAVDLVHETLPSFSFDKEYELIASYGDVASKKAESSSTAAPTHVASNPSAQIHDISAGNGSEETARREALTVAMMSETQKERDVCYFFLESVDWDLQKAIEMLRSMVA